MRQTLLLLLFMLILPSTTISASSEESIREIIRNNYVDPVDDSLLDQSIDDIFQGLDPYSRYLSQEELDAIYNSIDQKLTGIGITIRSNIIQTVIPDSPAEERGIQAGDTIIEVNQQSVTGMDESELADLLRGEELTSITLTLSRKDKRITVELERRELTIPSVSAQILSGNIGYMRISSFNRNLGNEIADALHEHEANHWIVDLRNNPGGYVNAAQQLAGFFPTVETALLVEHRGETTPWEPVSQKITFHSPTSLLVNEYSASASEISAGFYKDYELGPIYGQTTFGKGLMQRPYEIENEEGAVLLSVNRFYTPRKNRIQDVGVSPDIETYLPLLDAHYNAMEETTAYPSFETIDQVKEEKVFTVELNKPAAIASIRTQTEIWQLGGYEIDTVVEKVDDTTFTVDPETLVPGSEYVLTVKPGWRTTDGDVAPQGVLQRFTVE